MNKHRLHSSAQDIKFVNFPQNRNFYFSPCGGWDFEIRIALLGNRRLSTWVTKQQQATQCNLKFKDQTEERTTPKQLNIGPKKKIY